MLTCRNCNQQLPDGARFCYNCGAKIEAVCASCGSVLAPGMKFCMMCGAPVNPAASVTSAPVSVPSAPSVSSDIGIDFSAPAPTAPARPAPKVFKPGEPFFKKWIAEHKDWADSHCIEWVSKFYNDYAVAVKWRGNNQTPSYTLIRGEQTPEDLGSSEFLFSADCSCNMPQKNIYSYESSRFKNGSKYFAYDIFYHSNIENDELFKDINFLKAFGGKEFDAAKAVKGLHFCGVFAYDGTWLYSKNSILNSAIYFTHARYIPFGDYIAKYNIKGKIPQKGFFPYNIVKPETGEVIAHDVALPYSDTNNNFLQDNGNWMFYFIPYNDKITNFNGAFEDEYSEDHLNDGAKRFVKILLTESGEIVPCDNLYRVQGIDGYGVIILQDPVTSDFTLINRLGIRINFSHPQHNRKYNCFTRDSIGRKTYIVLNFEEDEDESFAEVFKENEFGLLNGEKPQVDYVCTINMFDWWDYPVEYNGRSYAAYVDNKQSVCVIDEDFKQIIHIANASEPHLFTSEGILYCSYKKSDNVTEWIYVNNLNTNKVIAKLPLSEVGYNKINKIITVNGNCILKASYDGVYYTARIMLKGVDELAKSSFSGFLEEGKELAGDSDYAMLLEKLKRLPKSYGVYYNDDWREKGYFLVDFNTGDAEKITKDELISRFG